MALTPEHYGIWVGASVHEVGQVVAASYQGGEAAGDAAVITKMARVLVLGPMIFALGIYVKRSSAASATVKMIPIPWFVIGFCLAIALASAIEISQAVKITLSFFATLLLTIALAAIGLQTQFLELRARGIRPLVLAATSTLLITIFSYLLLVL